MPRNVWMLPAASGRRRQWHGTLRRHSRIGSSYMQPPHKHTRALTLAKHTSTTQMCHSTSAKLHTRFDPHVSVIAYRGTVQPLTLSCSVAHSRLGHLGTPRVARSPNPHDCRRWSPAAGSGSRSRTVVRARRKRKLGEPFLEEQPSRAC